MTICLCMIARNEAHVVARALASARPLIDSWLVVDTGSTDGTQDAVRETLDGLPGRLVDRPWVDFGTNRTEALALARPLADYALVLDADDVLIPADGFRWPLLDRDAYELRVEHGNLVHHRLHLFRSGSGWRYEGAVHECPTHDRDWTRGRVEGLTYRVMGGGARSAAPDKYRRDADLLRDEVLRDRSNARATYYLAQSLRDAGCADEALRWYRARAAMPGWPEETWHASYQVARLTGSRDDYLEAYRRNPQRAEPLYWLARQERLAGAFALGEVFALAGLVVYVPTEGLFIERDVYEWRLLDELAIDLWWMGRRAESAALCDRLLSNPNIPETERERVMRNRAYCDGK